MSRANKILNLTIGAGRRSQAMTGVRVMRLIRVPLAATAVALAISSAPGLLGLAVGARLPLPPGVSPCPDTALVVVARLEEPLWNRRSVVDATCWRLATKHERKDLDGCTTDNWESRYWQYASALVNQAHGSGMDGASLDRCLKALFPTRGGLTLLPVAAYEARQKPTSIWRKAKPAWVIVMKWEGDGAPIGLTHIRAYACDAATGAEIGFATCS